MYFFIFDDIKQGLFLGILFLELLQGQGKKVRGSRTFTSMMFFGRFLTMGSQANKITLRIKEWDLP